MRCPTPGEGRGHWIPACAGIADGLPATFGNENFWRQEFSKDFTPTLTLPLKGEGTDFLLFSWE